MQVIHAGSAGFDALLYPEQSLNNIAYIQNQFTNFSDTLTDMGRQFIAGTKALFEEIKNSDAVQLARNAIRAAKGLFSPNTIVPLRSYEDFQVAQPIMQRYIMAMPEIREYYHEQRCDGYQDTYVDLQPGIIGEDHYDYRRVMNGIVKEFDDTWGFNFYPDEIREGERDLTFSEQVDILSTWEMMKLYMFEKKDPTNIYGGKLG